MRIAFPSKAPWEQLTYGIWLYDWLQGATLTSATWTIESGAGLVIMTQGIDNVNGLALVKLDQGTIGVEYRLKCQFTASNGERGQRDAWIKIIEPKPQ